MSEKDTLRRWIRSILARTPPEARAVEEARLRERLAPIVAGAGGVLLAYLPLADEPDLTPLLRDRLAAGGRLALPRVEGRRLLLQEVTDLETGIARGRLGVREPVADGPAVEPGAMTTVLVPGRAFDASGGRLGRGGGFYDRLLRAAPKAWRVAAALSAQMVPIVPRADHDEPVDLVVTPAHMLRAPRRPAGPDVDVETPPC